MDASFEGEYCQQLILVSDTFMHQLFTRLLISFLQSLDPFIFFKTLSVFPNWYMYIQFFGQASRAHVLLAQDNYWHFPFARIVLAGPLLD